MESLQPKTTPTMTTSTSHSTRTPSTPTCGWVFIGSLSNNDINYIGTSLHVYTNNLLQVEAHDSNLIESQQACVCHRLYKVYINKFAAPSLSNNVTMR